VLPAARGKGIGKELFLRAVSHSYVANINELYLLTTTAEEFFFQAPLQNNRKGRCTCAFTVIR
jgi:N-acetylglutamate synthase-like GNAT family acetyltransferase